MTLEGVVVLLVEGPGAEMCESRFWCVCMRVRMRCVVMRCVCHGECVYVVRGVSYSAPPSDVGVSQQKIVRRPWEIEVRRIEAP